MSHRVSSSNLDEAVKELFAAWQGTRDSWRDEQSLAFEKQYLEKLPGLTMQARGVIEEIDTLMRKIRIDCDDNPL